MTPESCNSATRKELVERAKEHYNKLSDASCDFNSVVIKALDHYAAAPELLRDVEALCDAVVEEPVSYDCDSGHAECVFCQEYTVKRQRKPIPHAPDCPVLLAKRIRERMKADD